MAAWRRRRSPPESCARAPAHERVQHESAGHLVDPRPEVAPAQAGQAGEEAEIVPDRQREVDAGVLGCQSDERAGAMRVPQGVDPGDPHGAGVRAPEPGHDRHEGGLPGAVRTQQAEDVARLHGEVDAVEGDRGAIGLAQALDVERGHRSRPGGVRSRAQDTETSGPRSGGAATGPGRSRPAVDFVREIPARMCNTLKYHINRRV